MTERTISSEFRNVDNAETANHLIQYLEYMDSLPETRRMKVNTYGYLGLKEWDVVLDAGCGPGYDAIRMAGMVGTSGKVIGIDISRRMIEIAEAKAKDTTLPVSFRTGDARNLPFANASFDAVRIERLLQIVSFPDRILDEMIRVLRPGGRLLSIEPDWETFVCDPGSRDTARTFFRFCADQFPDGSTGRKLYRYFRERGLKEVVVHPEPLVLHNFSLATKMMNMDQFLTAAQEKGVLERDEVAAWLADLKDADAKGQFTFAGMMFAVMGKKV
jgi:ubiquinone/menaquinone biosynthesis C-methylase UbiE